MPGVKCIADDELIYGRDHADHDSCLKGFMMRCQQKGINEFCEVDGMGDRMSPRRLNMWLVATVFTCERQMSRHHHHRTRPLLRCMFPFARSPMRQFSTTVPEEVDPPASSQENDPLSRPEVAPAEPPPKLVLRRSERQRRPPKPFIGFVLAKP